MNAFIAVIVILVFGALWMWWANRHTPRLGVHGRKLLPLKRTPNGVSSFELKLAKRIEPWALEEPGDWAIDEVIVAAETLGNARIAHRSENYVHLVFTSAGLGWCDDVEFWVNEEDSRMEMRAQARVGYSDFTTNFKRLLALKDAFFQN